MKATRSRLDSNASRSTRSSIERSTCCWRRRWVGARHEENRSEIVALKLEIRDLRQTMWKKFKEHADYSEELDNRLIRVETRLERAERDIARGGLR